MKFLDINSDAALTKGSIDSAITAEVAEVSVRKNSDGRQYIVQVADDKGDLLVFNGQSAIYVTEVIYDKLKLETKVLISGDGIFLGYAEPKAKTPKVTTEARAGSGGHGSNRYRDSN